MTTFKQPDVIVLDDVTPRENIEKPRMYKLVVVDDEISTMTLVREVFENFFNKSGDEAWECMMEVHNKGASVGGVYTKDIAATKLQQIAAFSGEYPLRVATVKL